MIEAWIVALAAGYLIGSIPAGLWIGRAAGGIDLRTAGSRRTGATNVLRSLGLRWSALVFALDIAKGALPVAIVLAAWDSPTAEVLAGLAAVGGAIFPLYAGFRGGRGAATGLGALLALTPLAGVIALGLLSVLLLVTRIMSLSVLLGMAATAAAQGLLVAFRDGPDAYYGYAVGAFVIITLAHRDNVWRLLAGTEPRLGQTGRSQPLPAEPQQ